jgi:hypothetical protein
MELYEELYGFLKEIEKEQEEPLFAKAFIADFLAEKLIKAGYTKPVDTSK